MIANVHVKSGARVDSLAYDQVTGAYQIAVRARPIEGGANIAIIELLAKHLQIPKSQISLKSGARSKIKRFEY